MAKRGASGLSQIVAVDKPVGKTSHDVVDACRRIYGERRIGHTGTLDPLASGILLVCIGPATRLDKFLTEHDKSYDMDIVFGSATDTDDADGNVISRGPIDERLFDLFYQRDVLERFKGRTKQLPPVYSAIKVQGKKSYEAARQGTIIDLKPRDIEIYSLEGRDFITSMEADDGRTVPVWRVSASVSKGTYMRSLARDLGKSQSTCAHVGMLRRTMTSGIPVEMAVSLDKLAEEPDVSLIDPVALLGTRFAFADESVEADLINGRAVDADKVHLNEALASPLEAFSGFTCLPAVYPSQDPALDDELVSFVVGTRLKALYRYSSRTGTYKPECVFNVGVARGSDIHG